MTVTILSGPAREAAERRAADLFAGLTDHQIAEAAAFAKERVTATLTGSRHGHDGPELLRVAAKGRTLFAWRVRAPRAVEPVAVRGSLGPWLCAIAPLPDPPHAPPRVVQMWVPNPGRWEIASVWMHAEVYEAWALHERARADAERALRVAVEAWANGKGSTQACREAERALVAAGGVV
jgi:hypothetical protein